MKQQDSETASEQMHLKWPYLNLPYGNGFEFSGENPGHEKLEMGLKSLSGSVGTNAEVSNDMTTNNSQRISFSFVNY